MQPNLKWAGESGMTLWAHWGTPSILGQDNQSFFVSFPACVGHPCPKCRSSGFQKGGRCQNCRLPGLPEGSACQIRLTDPPAGCLTPKLMLGKPIGGWQMQTKPLSETSAVCHLPCPDDGRSCCSCCPPVRRNRAQGQFQCSRTMQLGMVRNLQYAP